MSTFTPTFAPGYIGSTVNNATTLAGGGALSPTSTASDFDHLSASCASIQSYVHVDNVDGSAVENGSVVSSTGSVVWADDDEIVWPMSPSTDMSSPVSASDREQDIVSLASSMSLSLSMMSLGSASTHPLSRSAAGDRSREHARSRSVPMFGEDVVLVGSRAASAGQLANDDVVPPIETSLFQVRNMLWSEEVERERAIVNDRGSHVSTPTAGVFDKTAASTTPTKTIPTMEEGGNNQRVIGTAWKRRNRRRKAAAAAAVAEGHTALQTPTTHHTDVIIPHAPTPVKNPFGANPVNDSTAHKQSGSVSSSVGRSYPSPAPTPAPNVGGTTRRSVTPPIRPRAPEPIEGAPTPAKSKKGSKRKSAGKPKTKAKVKGRNNNVSGGSSAANAQVETPATKANKTASEVVATSETRTARAGLGQRPVVDDVSENGDDRESLLSTAYEEAVNFMNQFILNPSYYTSQASRLTFLQALILELGLCHEFSLPNSLTAARALLRSHAFLNVRDYLAVRAQGVEALRQAMYPSRSALARDLRGTKQSVKGVEGERGVRAELGWVKETGLTVFLVSCYHH